MNTKAIMTLVFAIILILAVLGITGYMTYSGATNRTRFDAVEAWQKPFGAAQSMKAMPFPGGKAIVLQSANTVRALDAEGNQIFTHDFPGPMATTFADVDGDNISEIIVLCRQPEGPALIVLNAKGESLHTFNLADFGAPARAAVLRFPAGLQMIAGDTQGKLVSVDMDGRPLWNATLLHGSGDAIRGLDDVKINGWAHLAAANHDGQVAVYDSAGTEKWSAWIRGDLRRMRSFDLKGDGKGQVIAGGENGTLLVLDAETGTVLQTKNLGQAITEIREVETNGEPTSREFVAGGKKGGVWAFTADGKELWSATVSEKVTEIAGVDVDDDGADEVIIGDDSGAVNIFAGKTGNRSSLAHQSSGIARIDAEKVTGSDQIVVADANAVHLFSLKMKTAPIWYSPMLAGFLISAIIAVVAWFIATAPAKPVTRMEVVDQSVEGLQTRRKMLHASVADVERLRQSGEMAPDAYLSRLKDLRAEMADTEAALIKAGVKITPETMKCPSCGGTVPLGTDRCEYCGQVVIA